jgi:DNA-binding CsgD family transcriptional regulator
MSAHLLKLHAITQLLATKPTLETLTNYLSLEHCPSGEVSWVYFARISKSRTLIIESSQGYELAKADPGNEFPIERSRPSGRAIIENQIIFETNSPDYYQRYPAISDSLKYPWKSQVSIPINDHYFLQCGRYADFMEGDELFYQNLQSLMQIYFARIGKVSSQIGDLYGKALTKRQATILDLMKSGKTNEAIAIDIGFSPSLVKQETMLIFSKLGLSGRRDLTDAS